MNQRNLKISHESHKLARIFEDPELDRVRRKLSRQVYFFFFQKYARSYEVEIYQRTDREAFDFEDREISFRIGDKQDHDKEFAVGLHRCKCQDSDRSGLACRHLIAIRRYYKMAYLDLIDKRWIIREPKTRAGTRPKISRRHQIGY